MAAKEVFAEQRNVVIAGVGVLIFETLLFFWGISIPIFAIILLFLVSFPYKIGRNVYGLFGGVNYDDGDVYSLVELYGSGENLYSFFSLSFFSYAEKEKSSTLGLNLFTRAERNWLFAGVNMFSKSEKVFVCVGANVATYAKSETVCIFGGNILSYSSDFIFSLFGINLASVSPGSIISFIACNIFCKSPHIEVIFGVNICSFSKGIISSLIGGNFFCCAKEVYLGFGIPLIMNICGTSVVSWKKTKELD
jgi:hypothetical protein